MNRLLRVSSLIRLTTRRPLSHIHHDRSWRAIQTGAAPVSQYSTKQMTFYTLFRLIQLQALDDGVRFPYLETSLHFNSPLEGQSPVDGSPQPRWGWPIYRTAYGNHAIDRQFARFTRVLFHKIRDLITSSSDTAELEKFMDFPVFEGEHLDALSSAGVRLQFEEWAMKRGIPRRVPLPGDPELPCIYGITPGHESYAGARFNHCLMVDRRSLDSLDSDEPFIGIVENNWLPEWHPFYLEGGASFVVDQRYEIIEGNPSGYVGWWYLPIHLLVEEYDCLSQGGYEQNYWAPRPPDVFSSDLWGTEKWRGDEEEGHSKGIQLCTAPYTYDDE